MSANGSGRGCGRRSHAGKSIAVYDALPREVRDKLKIARNNLCASCVQSKVRRYGLERTLKDLDFERRRAAEKHGREVWYVLEEELRP